MSTEGVNLLIRMRGRSGGYPMASIGEIGSLGAAARRDLRGGVRFEDLVTERMRWEITAAVRVIKGMKHRPIEKTGPTRDSSILVYLGEFPADVGCRH